MAKASSYVIQKAVHGHSGDGDNVLRVGHRHFRQVVNIHTHPLAKSIISCFDASGVVTENNSIGFF